MKSNQRSNTYPVTWSAGLFLLSLVVRLPFLGKFLTADEFLWVDRSKNFLAGLLDSGFLCESPTNHTGFEQAVGLACTLRTGHPGVTTMWTGSVGILLRYIADGMPVPLMQYVTGLHTNPLDAALVAPARLPTVVLTSIWVAVVAWLVWRLFGSRWVGLVAGLLLALDPFHAALSRVIHHDALATSFMTVSVLTALMYWVKREGRIWLVVSGLTGGLAFLSKSSALILNPFIAVVGIWYLLHHRRQTHELSWRQVGTTVADGLLWFGSAVGASFAVWPAMWVIPADAVRTVFTIGLKYAGGGHAKGNFFLGDVSNDPGFFFYPVSWLLRSSPLVWAGLLLLVVWGYMAWRRQRGSSTGEERAGEWLQSLGLMGVYVLMFAALMVWGEKKQDRYFLPVYPMMTIAASVGLALLVDRVRAVWTGEETAVAGRGKHIRAWIGGNAVVIAIVLFQGGLIVANLPYYFTYYNPLLGGIRAAQSMITLGWGEGLDLAAAHLNQMPEAEALRVSSWYQSTFAPFFKGEAISYSKEKGKAMAGDYVVFYINQMQRRFPDDELFDFFERRYEPEAVIPLKGVEYVLIYPGPHIDHYVEDRVDEHQRSYRGIAALLGWDWPTAADPDVPTVPAGGELPFRLYWEYLGKMPDELFFFRLLEPNGEIAAEGVSHPVDAENGDFAVWKEGQIITEEGSISVPLHLTPGRYQLQIGFYTKAPAVTEGELMFALPAGEDAVIVSEAGE
jgi:4-amino-4-deoxy-L-arabinose transferase-like glycosyltransferase